MPPMDPERDLAGEVGLPLTEGISAAMVGLYSAFCAHDRTTVTTYINAKIILCLLKNVLTESEDALVAASGRREVIDGRVAFRAETEDEFAAAIEQLTARRVVAFLSANQTIPGVAGELFFLDAPPLLTATAWRP